MNLLPKLLAGGVAGATLLLGASAALAAPGVATGAVNVRSGPGTSYVVRDTLYRGEDVDIGRCTGGWCYVTHDGADGWVSANYLQGVDDGPVYVEPDYYPPDYYPPVYAPPVYAPPPVFITPGYPYNSYRYRHHRRYNRPAPRPPVAPAPGQANPWAQVRPRPSVRPVPACVTDPNLPQCSNPWAGVSQHPGNAGNPGNGNHQNGAY